MSKRVLIALGVAVAALVAAFMFFKADMSPEAAEEAEDVPEAVEVKEPLHVVKDEDEGPDTGKED